jgi:CRP-like cAMP-binding protein
MSPKAPVVLSLPDPFARLDCKSIQHDYADGQVIFRQGDRSDSVSYICNGYVKLTVTGRGKKAVIAILKRGDFFGENSLTRDSSRISTATSIKTSKVTSVGRQAMLRLLRLRPTFASGFAASLLVRLDCVEKALADNLLSSSEQRLARLLIQLSSSGRMKNSATVPVKVSQETLAEMTGTTRSRVSFFMNRFRDRGYITYNGDIRVRPALSRTFLEH